MAHQSGIYAKRGLAVDLLPAPEPGAEPPLVRQMQEDQWKTDPEALVLGCVEQNTLIAAQLYGREPLKAVSAMLHSTPLAIAAAPGSGVATLADLAGKSVAAADDTAEIIRTALFHVDPALPDQVRVVAMHREEKLPRFQAGEVDTMQVYTTTEALQLQHDFGTLPVLLPFGERHGYAQVVYAHAEALKSAQHRTVGRAFLDATYEGWTAALRNPDAAADAVCMARAAAGVEGVEGEYSDTREFHLASLQALSSFVAPIPGYPIGQMDLTRFMAAADQIASDLLHQTHFTVNGSANDHESSWVPGELLLPRRLIDTTLWPALPLMRGVTGAPHREGIISIDGQALADRRRAEIKTRAARFHAHHKRAPMLGVVEVLPLENDDGAPTAEVASTSLRGHPGRDSGSPNKVRGSWLDKEHAGGLMGVHVETVTLPAASTMREVTKAVRRFNRRADVDGVLMELPDKLKGLPSHLNVSALLAEVSPGKCVDGMTPHSVASMVSAAATGTGTCTGRVVQPTTPGSVMELLEGAGVHLNGRHAVVVGNSRLCGQPTALMLQKEGAAVSVVTSSTPDWLQDELCAQADVVVSCVGTPGILNEGNLRPGAVVVNVGTHPTAEGTLVPDVTIGHPMGHMVTPTPGGVGPNPIMILFENVLERAEHNAETQRAAEKRGVEATKRKPGTAAAPLGWEVEDERCLRKAFTAPSFEAAAIMLQDVAALTADLNHHPLVTLGPASAGKEDPCFNHGCVLAFELRSIEAGGITDADVMLAKAIDAELE